MALLAASASGVAAQGPPAGASVTVSVLTFGPGEEVFERFGHNAIRVQRPGTGLDVAFNWGMFTFDQPHFIQRFLTGDTKYWMQGFSGAAFIAEYQAQHREVWEQELALSASEKDSLVKFLDWNQREENRYYRYDYYRDNCSTRVRDAIDGIIGGAIRNTATSRAHGVTYRSETLRLAKAFPALLLGMDFVLGPRADTPSSGWDELFVPMRLRDLLREVRVAGPNGTLVPLVAREVKLVSDPTYAEAIAPPSMIPMGRRIGLLVAAIFLVAMSSALVRNVAVRWIVVAIASAWSLAVGLSGAVLLFAGIFTRHYYMGANLNLLLATPLSLAIAVVLPFAFRPSTSDRLPSAAVALTSAAAVAAVLGAVITIGGPLAQLNGSAVALLLPGHLMLALFVRKTLRKEPRA
ncbi:MAG: DUF4105 domain-containing protein [Gemmatimonadetes bacterium]|nr:DUF4105 domain-containing protein [Gemmatimonadota bacterium]